MNYQKLTTPKLFFGKWPYKVKFVCNQAWMVKRLGVQRTKDYAQKGFDSAGWGGHRVSQESRLNLLHFTNAIEPFLDKNITTRAESGIFSVYCADESLFNEICSALDRWIVSVYVPANDREQEFMLTNTRKKVLCNHLPFKTYQYKVYLKATMPANTKENFYSWISNYAGKIQAPNHTAQWLSGKKYWATCPAIYVKDSATLSMVGLFLGDRLSKVEEYVPRSMINILSKE